MVHDYGLTSRLISSLALCHNSVCKNSNHLISHRMLCLSTIWIASYLRPWRACGNKHARYPEVTLRFWNSRDNVKEKSRPTITGAPTYPEVAYFTVYF